VTWYVPGVNTKALDATVAACRDLIEARFPDGSQRGAAAVLLADGRILTGTGPDFINPSTSVCHEIEPYCAAFRLGQAIVASVCLHRAPGRGFLVLSPCGVCRERLAMHGPDVAVAVADEADATRVRWLPLKEALPHYWMTAFPDELDGWSS
jgi:cytidine deaminase